MREIKNSVQSVGTGKATYEKPAMQMCQMEVETSILTELDSGMSGGLLAMNDRVNPLGETFTDLKV